MAEAGAVRDDGTRAGHDPDDLEGYAGVALRAALALRSGKPTVMVLNARNRIALPFLDPDAIVETRLRRHRRRRPHGRAPRRCRCTRAA